MRCPNCGFENPGEIKFCGQCGTSLLRLCASCGFENPPGFKFCGECGAPLAETASLPASDQKVKPPSPRGKRSAQRFGAKSNRQRAPEAERRQLTVMFCDLIGSTALSQQLDPEVLREVVHLYQETCGAVIARFEGHVAQYLGDGILVYFGYPQAHEDDAQRAVRSSLGIIEEMSRLNKQLQREKGVTLAVRLGIHTGLVVIGEIGDENRREQLAMGQTPNIAARLEKVAEPNTVAVSAATYRLTRGFFTYQPFGAHALKGVAQPIHVYLAQHDTGVRSRIEAAITSGLTPLVGKEREVTQLLASWEQVKNDAGQVVLLGGEAGIGKSRLLQAFKERVGGSPYLWLECRCSPYYQESALYPMIELLHRLLEFRREDSPEEKLRKLEAKLNAHGLPLPEAVPLFAALLSLPLGERYSPINLTPQRQKQKTQEALLKVFFKMAAKQPLIQVVEDLHWADPSTLEMLGLCIAQKIKAPILMLLTFRPEFQPPWPLLSEVKNITLNRLDPTQVETMIAQVTHDKGLPAEVIKQIIAKTDGNPLFVEELTQMVLESGLLQEDKDRYELTGALPPLAIPATLQDSLMARLDRLAPVKEIAQLSATLGREFSYELIQAVADVDETTLRNGLARLVEAQLLFQHATVGNGAAYIFKHALIQDAAYQSLLKSKRQQYHQKIANVMVEKFPEMAITQPEILARHFTEAGDSQAAITYWQWAGERAIERSANLEAISDLTRGLELIATLKESLQRKQQELDLLISLGLALIATKGYAAPEVEKTFTRAQELCEHIGETPQRVPVMLGLWECALVRANFQRAHQLAQEFMQFAQHANDPSALLTAHLTVGITLFHRGELNSAHTHLTQALHLYDPQLHGADIFLYSQDPGVVGLSYLAQALWLLGYPNQALQKAHAALQLARKLDHPFSIAFALNFVGEIHQLRCEMEDLLRLSDELIMLSTEQGFLLWQACGFTHKGQALSEMGEVEEGAKLFQQGLEIFDKMGANIGRSGGLAVKATLAAKLDQLEEALKALDQAFILAECCAERELEADLYRIKGELLLQKAKTVEQSAQLISEAESCFRQALDIARDQEAKSLELRAAVNLANLWREQGKKDEARNMLAEIYNWFTEGFETIDLQAAKKLLGVM